MTAQQQTVSLFAGIGVVLLVASLVGYALKTVVAKGQPHSTIDNLNARIKAWWVMVLVIGCAFLFGKNGVMLLFLFISFAALREFMSLTYTRGGDYLALAAAFFVVLPLQYLLIYIGWYGMYSIFIPVYVFLLLPILEVIAGDTKRFLERTAKMQWGLMICVFCISHVPALLTLDIPGYDERNLLLIVFLVVVVQSSDVLQYVWGKLFGKRKVAPEVSPSKTVEGLVGGVLSATALGAMLWWITPFSSVAGRADGVRDHRDGLLRRPRDVGDQARPRRQGLGPHDRGPRRDARPSRLRRLRRPDLLPPHAVLVGVGSGLAIRARKSREGFGRPRAFRVETAENPFHARSQSCSTVVSSGNSMESRVTRALCLPCWHTATTSWLLWFHWFAPAVLK